MKRVHHMRSHHLSRMVDESLRWAMKLEYGGIDDIEAIPLMDKDLLS